MLMNSKRGLGLSGSCVVVFGGGSMCGCGEGENWARVFWDEEGLCCG